MAADLARAAALACLFLFVAAGPATAQVGASAAIDSDYRVRGLSFSDGKPAASLTLTYDHPSGAYLAVTGLAGDTSRTGLTALGYQANLGYAARFRSGLVLDVGVSNARFTEYVGAGYAPSYSEAYVGLAGRDIGAHLYYSPDYFGQKVQTLYAEVDGVVRPTPRLRLFAHAGLLTPLNPWPGGGLDHTQYDLRAGAAVEVKALELRLAWTHAQHSAAYLTDRSRDAVVASAAYAF